MTSSASHGWSICLSVMSRAKSLTDPSKAWWEEFCVLLCVCVYFRSMLTVICHAKCVEIHVGLFLSRLKFMLRV